jgi:hypothetical protein
MKVKIPLAIVIVLAAAVGYLMGTDSGRQRRDVILVKLGRGEGGNAEQMAAVMADAGEQVADAVADAGEQITDAIADAGADA